MFLDSQSVRVQIIVIFTDWHQISISHVRFGDKVGRHSSSVWFHDIQLLVPTGVFFYFSVAQANFSNA